MSALIFIKGLWAAGKKIPLWLWVAIGVLILFVGVYRTAYNNGVEETTTKWNKERSELQAAVEKAKQENTTINMIVDTVVKTEVVRIRENAKEIIREIPVYIPVDTPDLPAGFRLLHDAAATGSQADRSRLPVAEAVSVADVTVTVSENYASCLVWREQVLGWQEWYRQLQ